MRMGEEENMYKLLTDAIGKVISLPDAAHLHYDIRSSDLPEGSKRYLLGLLTEREKTLGNEMQIYENRVQEFLSKLNADDHLKQVLKAYFLDYAQLSSLTPTTLIKNVLPWVGGFIEYVREKKGSTLTIDDFDSKNLKEFNITQYYEEKKWTETTMKAANSFIQVFGKWLAKNGYISKFPYVKISVEEEIDSIAGTKKQTGKPRTREEIDRIMAVIGVPAPKVERWRLPLFRHFALVEMSSGARPGQLLPALRYKDLLGGDTATDAKGEGYLVIPYGTALRREKIQKGGKNRKNKKERMPDIFLHTSYAREIIAYKDKMGWDEETRLFPQTREGAGVIPARRLNTRMKRVAEMTGIPDFTADDFRHTWASVLFTITGRTERSVGLLAHYGGWKSPEVSRDVYVKVMTPGMALEIADKYKIYIPVEAEEDIELIRAGIPKVTYEEVAKLLEEIILLEIQVKGFRRDEEMTEEKEDVEALFEEAKRRLEKLGRKIEALRNESE
jgi:integrase